jgi:CRP/FNR family transcriptional regulator
MVTPLPADALLSRLRGLAFFSGLDDGTLAALARTARRRDYQTGEIIVLEGEAQPGLYFLDSGYVKVVKIAPSGREQTLLFLEPGDTFNEIGVFSDRPNPATAVALEPTAVWLIPRDSLKRLLREQPDFAQSVIERMAERMLILVGLVSDLSLRPVTGRLARLLLEAAVDDLVQRPRWFTQAELAARLGTVPDVIQRSLRALEVDGLLAVERGQIRILDRPGLERIAA